MEAMVQFMHVNSCPKLEPKLLYVGEPKRKFLLGNSNDTSAHTANSKVFLGLDQALATPQRRIEQGSYSSTHSLTSAQDESERSASHPGRSSTGTHSIGAWVVRKDAVAGNRTPVFQISSQSL
jgi:hypothetical protein